MFGKPRDIDDTDTLDANAIDGFFGDEDAAEAIVEVHELQHRVEQVEQQITSQFTSLATYAQIAQEQVEMARAEAKSSTERSEQRITSLIERERADRISSFTGVPVGSAPDVSARIDALEHSVAQIRQGLDECLLRQKSLADAITTMFERLAPAPAPSTTETVTAETTTTESTDTVDELTVDDRIDDEPIDDALLEDVRDGNDDALDADADAEATDDRPLLPAPSLVTPNLAPPTLTPTVTSPLSGPIADLSLNG